MFMKVSWFISAGVMLGICLLMADPSESQEPAPIRIDAARAPGEVPRGVEVQARGPIHEAFASPATEPKATLPIRKQPPNPIDEMPPEERPEGDVVWIGGYWSFDDDRNDFIWVSGCWRIKPVAKEWVSGYWREVGPEWQWVPGFWTSAQQQGKAAEPVTYHPEPPAPPNIAPPGDPPVVDSFFVPGYWMWNGDRYVWRAGYWARIRPDYVYVASHYRWTPQGYVFIPGYWDLQVSRRGVLYAPVSVDLVVLGPSYVYTPYFAVRDTLVLDAMFIRPVTCHYYFGDYYGPRYVGFGFEPCVVYSRRHYEPIFVYERWHYRDNPRWYDAQLTLVVARNEGRAPLPPRVYNPTVNVNVNVNVNVMIAPTRTVLAARGEKSIAMNTAVRAQVREAAVAHREAVGQERRRAESGAAGIPNRPRTASFNVPAAQAISTSGVISPQPTVRSAPSTVNPSNNVAQPGTNINASKTIAPGPGTQPNTGGNPTKGSPPGPGAQPSTVAAPTRGGPPAPGPQPAIGTNPLKGPVPPPLLPAKKDEKKKSP